MRFLPVSDAEGGAAGIGGVGDCAAIPRLSFACSLIPNPTSLDDGVGSGVRVIVMSEVGR